MLNKISNRAVWLLILGFTASTNSVSESYRLMYLQQQQTAAIDNINQELAYIEKHYSREFAALNLNNPDSLINTIIDHAKKKYWFLALSRYRHSLNKSIQKLKAFNVDDYITSSPALDKVLSRVVCVKNNLKRIDTCLTQNPAFIAENNKHRGLVVIGIAITSFVLIAFLAPITVLFITMAPLAFLDTFAPLILIELTVSIVLTATSITTIALLNKRLKELSVRKKHNRAKNPLLSPISS